VLFLFIVLAFVSCQTGTKKANEKAEVEKAELVEATINIGGLHCNNCVASVKKGINGLAGIETLEVTLSDSTAVVSFDPEKTNLAEIEKTIETRGYTIKE